MFVNSSMENIGPFNCIHYNVMVFSVTYILCEGHETVIVCSGLKMSHLLSLNMIPFVNIIK